jgi:hypothetical protein
MPDVPVRTGGAASTIRQQMGAERLTKARPDSADVASEVHFPPGSRV